MTATQNVVHTWVGISSASRFSSIAKMGCTLQICRSKRYTYTSRYPICISFFIIGKMGPLYGSAVQNVICTWVVISSASQFSSFGKMGSTLRLSRTKRYTYMSWYLICIRFWSIGKMGSTLWLCHTEHYTYTSWYLICILLFINW